MLDSIVYSEGWKAYNKLSLNGFRHRRINHDKHWLTARCLSTVSRISGARPNVA
jgi:transposase-like protein